MDVAYAQSDENCILLVAEAYLVVKTKKTEF